MINDQQWSRILIGYGFGIIVYSIILLISMVLAVSHLIHGTYFLIVAIIGFPLMVSFLPMKIINDKRQVKKEKR